MINPEEIYLKVIQLMDQSEVEYKLFSHKPILSYEDSMEVQKEEGYIGTEGKSMVLKVDGKFIVYMTLQGRRLNFDSIKDYLKADKIRLATPEELKEHFGAEPGCAYPFGFDNQFDIYVDPDIYKQDWLLFSPVLPTKTVQAKGENLKRLFNSLENKVTEVDNFNQ